MYEIRMQYIGRNGRAYPCQFSPEAVREHWRKFHGVTLDYDTPHGTVHVDLYSIGYPNVSVSVSNRNGTYLPVRHHLNGLRTRSSVAYPDFMAWWC